MFAQLNYKDIPDKYVKLGKVKFYRFLLFYAIYKLCLKNKSNTYISPEIEFFNFSNKFLKLYRIEGEDIYNELYLIFRKASHKIYRLMLKKQLTLKNNNFLNLVIL